MFQSLKNFQKNVHSGIFLNKNFDFLRQISQKNQKI